MSGTHIGGKKTVQTNIKKYGQNFYKEIGKKGGSVKVPKGFAVMSPEKRSQCGSIGGRISKKGIAIYGRNENGKPLTRVQYERCQQYK